MAGRGIAVAAALLACIAWIACGSGGGEPANTPPAKRSNIVLYVIDTLRADSLGFADGSVASTPHIDGFAAEAIVFDRAYSTSSWTRAAMASLFSGIYPTRHRVHERSDSLGPDVATLAESLSSAGYATAFITANPNAGSFFGFDQGFDETIELYARRAPGRVQDSELIAESAELTERAIAWIDSVREPFFLVVLAVDPHDPYEPPPELVRDVALPIEPKTAKRRKIEIARRRWPAYQGEISANDRSFGQLLDSLRKSGRLERTIVALTSDHGEEFLEHGGFSHGRTLHEEVVRVPLVVRPAGTPPEQVRVTSPASLVDVAPTLLRLIGMEFPVSVDGVALIDPEDGVAAHPRTHFLASLQLDGRELAAIGDGEWKLLMHSGSGAELLFRIADDPTEQAPVPLDSVSAIDVLARLRPLLREFVGALERGPRETHPPELPEEARRTLEALGYIEKSD